VVKTKQGIVYWLLSGAQVAAVCWQLTHPSVFPLAHTRTPFFPTTWECKIKFLLKKKNKQKTKSSQPSVLPVSCPHALPQPKFHLRCKRWPCQKQSVQWLSKRSRGERQR